MPNATSARPTETIITWSSTPPRRVEVRSARIERSHVAPVALLVAPGEPAVQAVERAEALADDRHPDRQADQHEQVRAGARARGVGDPRREVDQPERDADPHHDGADRHQQHEHQRGRRPGRAQHLGHSMFPHFAATIVGCTASSLRRPISLRTWPACGRRSHRGGVIFPDGCVDLVWHGDAPGRRRARRRGRWSPSIAGRRRRSSACASGSARRVRRSGCPRGSSPTPTRPARRACGAPEVDERVAAGGLPGAARQVVRERLRGVDGRPAGPRRRARDGAARAPASTRSAPARRQRAPAAPALRRRRRLRAEDARARAALPALPRAGARRRRARAAGARARATPTRRTSRARPGRLVRPHAAGAPRRAAPRPPASASRRDRASDSFKPRVARAAYRAAVHDRRSSEPRTYIWATARVLEQRRFEFLFGTRRPGGRQGRAGALQDRRRRLRLRARARRARADEPAAAHLDRARGARGAGRDRRRGSRDHLADAHRARRRRPGRAADARAVAARAVVGHRDRGHAARDRAALRAALRDGSHPWLDARRGVLLDARSTRSRRRTRTRSRRRSRSSTRRRTASGPRPRRSGSGALVARAGARRQAARGLLARRDPPPARLRHAPGQPRPRVVLRRGDRGRLDHLEARAARGRRLARSRGRSGRPRSRSSGAGW